MFMVEKLCVFKVRHVYLFTSSSLSSMLCSTLLIVRYDSTAQRPTGNEREQREDEAEKTSFLVDKALSTMEKNLVMEKKLFSPSLSRTEKRMSQEQVKRQ